jgi:hypothetical protein
MEPAIVERGSLNTGKTGMNALTDEALMLLKNNNICRTCKYIFFEVMHSGYDEKSTVFTPFCKRKTIEYTKVNIDDTCEYWGYNRERKSIKSFS